MSIELDSFTTPWTRMGFHDELLNPRSFLRAAESNGRVIGYLCASQVLDEGHILNLGVHPLCRRMGIASRLIEDILPLLRQNGCKVIYLEVRSSNKAAISMYGKFGFVQTGKRKEYYRLPREDAVIMKLDIPD